MGPIGSKVIEVKGQICFLLVMFFFLFVPLLLPGPWADLKGQGHRGQRSNFLYLGSPWSDLHETW